MKRGGAVDQLDDFAPPLTEKGKKRERGQHGSFGLVRRGKAKRGKRASELSVIAEESKEEKKVGPCLILTLHWERNGGREEGVRACPFSAVRRGEGRKGRLTP